MTSSWEQHGGSTSYAEKRRRDNCENQRRCRARKESVVAVSAIADVEVLQQSQVAQSRTRSSYDRQTQRVSADIARDLGLYALSKLQGHSRDVHHLCIQKFLGQPLISRIVPPFLRNIAAVRVATEVVAGIKDGVTSHLKGPRKAKVVMAKDIICTFAAGSSVGSSRMIHGVLGLDRRNLKKGVERRLQLDAQKHVFWLNPSRSRRADAMTKAEEELVRQWWTNETSISPNRIDQVRKRIGVNQYEEHQVQYLQVSQVSWNQMIELFLKCLSYSFTCCISCCE